MNISFILMRKLILSIISLALLAGCAKKTTVTLSVKNGAGNVYYCVPVDDAWTVLSGDTLRVSTADTTFRINLRTEGIMHSWLSFDCLGGSCIFTPMGDDFSIFVDMQDERNPIRFGGENAAGRELYFRMSFDKFVYRYDWPEDFSKAPLDTSAVVMRANFDKIAAVEIAQFDSLRRKGEIDRRFYNFVKSDIELYYRTALAKVIAAKYTRDSVLFADYEQVWDQIYREQPLDPGIFITGMGKAYADTYLNQYIPYKKQITFQPRNYTEFVNLCAGLIDENITDPVVRKRYLMHWLYFICVNNKTHDKGVVGQIDKFRMDFPDSEIDGFLRNHKKEVERYGEIVASDLSPEIKFVADYDQIKTFGELLDRFKGRRLFVDLWFLSCGPCVREFGHSKDLKEFLRNNDIDMLYISVDAPELDEKWREAVKYYNLDGYHVRACEELQADLNEKCGVESFPRYLIVDDNGEILETNAKAPSSGQELIDQISARLAM